MKKHMKKQLLTLLLCMPLLGMAQGWINKYGEPNSDESAYSVKLTADGGYIATGRLGGKHLGLVKLDALGNTQWEVKIDSLYSIYRKGHEVLQTSDGGYMASGFYSYNGNADFLLVKTDNVGHTLWSETYGGAGKDIAYSMQQTTDGGYIMVGETSSYGNGQEDVWLVKTDANGVKLWDKTFGDTLADIGYAVKQTADGGLIIAGSSAVPFPNPINGSIPPQSYLIKTDANGNTQWEKTYFGYFNWGTPYNSTRDNEATDVQQTADGGYILTGRYEAAAGYHMMLFKTDANGDSLWLKTFADTTSSHSKGNSVKQTADGGYIIVGWSNYSSFYRLYYVRIDLNGNVLWEKRSNKRGEITDVQLTSDGGYIMTAFWDEFNWEDQFIIMKVNANGNVTSTTIIPINTDKGELKKITNYLGQETKPTKNTPLLYQYENGTVEKKIIIE
jgi:hypothetical protein